MNHSALFSGIAAMVLLAPQSHAGLIWWSPLNGNADAIVGADGVPFGAPTPVSDLNGNPNSAVSFNGTTDFFTIVPSQTLFTAGSMSLWVRPTNFTAGEAGVFSIGESGAGTDQYFTLHRNWRGDLDDGATRQDVASNATAPLNVWQHVALTFTAQGSLRMYIDGVLQNDVQPLTSNAAQYNFTHDWVLGTERTAEANRFFAGAVDDARLYDHELSSGEVSTLFAAGPQNVPEPTTVATLALCGLAAFGRRRRKR